MFPAANPVGVFGVITPDICNIIPIRPIIDPPATSPEDKLNMDLIYVETYSLLLDLKLLILTIKILFMRESTEGFNEKANENVRASKSLKKESENKNEL